jgi:hypothetical protein
MTTRIQPNPIENTAHSRGLYQVLVARGFSKTAARAMVAGKIVWAPHGATLLTDGKATRLQRQRAALYALVVLDLILRKSPLALFKDGLSFLPVGLIAKLLPDLLDGLDVTYTDNIRQWAYNTPAAKSDPHLRRLMEKAGWGGDPSKEVPGADEVLLAAIARDFNRLGGTDSGTVVTM